MVGRQKEDLILPWNPLNWQNYDCIHCNRLKASFPDNKTGRAFLYCIYKRQDNQKVDHLLASLLGQLAVRQSMVHESIRELDCMRSTEKVKNLDFHKMRRRIRQSIR